MPSPAMERVTVDRTSERAPPIDRPQMDRGATMASTAGIPPTTERAPVRRAATAKRATQGASQPSRVAETATTGSAGGNPTPARPPRITHAPRRHYNEPNTVLPGRAVPPEPPPPPSAVR